MKKFIIIITGIILAFGAFYYFKTFNFKSSNQSPTLVKQKQEKTAYNFLLLGYGGGVHEGTY